jgi:hypothetical protein
MSGPGLNLKVKVVSPPAGSTGTSHYVDELRLSVGGSAPLILRSDLDTGRLIPIPGPQYTVGDEHLLLLGWSSYGSGMQTIHALLLRVANDLVILQRELELTTSRLESALLIRRDGPDTILLGIPMFMLITRPQDDDDMDPRSLVFGPAKVDQLDSAQIQNLSYVAETQRNGDLLYSPPFQNAAFPQRVAWLSVGKDGFALLPRTR